MLVVRIGADSGAAGLAGAAGAIAAEQDVILFAQLDRVPDVPAYLDTLASMGFQVFTRAGSAVRALTPGERPRHVVAAKGALAVARLGEL